MKALGSWYPDKVRNSVFGMFGTCAFAGGIIGTALAVSFTNAKLLKYFSSDCTFCQLKGILL